jgi:hypothetical protein
MNASAYGLTTKISEDERQAFRKALELHYGQGMRMNDAFDQVEAGLMDRYYRRRKNYPEEIEAVNREARAAVMRELSGDQLAFESRQLRASKELQMAAIKATHEALDKLGRIVNGEVFVVEGKVIIPYPRDMIAAANVILEIARKGVMPATYPRRLGEFLEADKEEKPEQRKPVIPLMGVNPQFRSFQITGIDGTEYSAEVKLGEVVDVEPTEVEAAD